MMETSFENEERYRKAAKKVEDLKGFYGNLVAYVIVNIGFLILNLITSPNHLWFYWPMLGWGIGVVIHGMRVFGYNPFLGADWEARKTREFMEQEKRNNNNWE